MLDYMTLKTLHIACVALSGAGFLLRGGLMLAGSAFLNARPVKILPHIIDTLLLISGIGLAVSIEQYPGPDAWLTAKLVALLLYIGLGVVALRRGRTLGIRSAALFAALATFAYIIAVALSRSAWPF